jgi:phosphatidylinositol kinase/protein kinase (PI-3  family)
MNKHIELTYWHFHRIYFVYELPLSFAEEELWENCAEILLFATTDY